MLESILPAGVECQECFGEPPGGVIFPEEEQVIAHAVPARRREYAACGVVPGPAWAGWGIRRCRSCQGWAVHPSGRLGCGAV